MRLIGMAVVVVALLAPSTSQIGPTGDNWPQWRGPSGRGVSDTTGFPDEWSPEKNIASKTAIAGRGHSSPVVCGPDANCGDRAAPRATRVRVPSPALRTNSVGEPVYASLVLADETIYIRGAQHLFAVR